MFSAGAPILTGVTAPAAPNPPMPACAPAAGVTMLAARAQAPRPGESVMRERERKRETAERRSLVMRPL